MSLLMLHSGALGGTGPSSDAGWGCMLRCGQMILGQALVCRHLGRGEEDHDDSCLHCPHVQYSLMHQALSFTWSHFVQSAWDLSTGICSLHSGQILSASTKRHCLVVAYGVLPAWMHHLNSRLSPRALLCLLITLVVVLYCMSNKWVSIFTPKDTRVSPVVLLIFPYIQSK